MKAKTYNDFDDTSDKCVNTIVVKYTELSRKDYKSKNK